MDSNSAEDAGGPCSPRPKAIAKRHKVAAKVLFTSRGEIVGVRFVDVNRLRRTWNGSESEDWREDGRRVEEWSRLDLYLSQPIR